jgi:hypothetical protein
MKTIKQLIEEIKQFAEIEPEPSNEVKMAAVEAFTESAIDVIADRIAKHLLERQNGNPSKVQP